MTRITVFAASALFGAVFIQEHPANARWQGGSSESCVQLRESGYWVNKLNCSVPTGTHWGKTVTSVIEADVQATTSTPIRAKACRQAWDSTASICNSGTLSSGSVGVEPIYVDTAVFTGGSEFDYVWINVDMNGGGKLLGWYVNNTQS
jgi:hypothetical protein